MPFIRVTDAETQQKIDVNIAHIVAFYPNVNRKRPTSRSLVRLTTGDIFDVQDEARQIRSYIKKEEGKLPDPIEETVNVVHGSV